MPTLNRIGKDKVVNHHHDVPFKLLNHKYGYHDGKESKKKTDSGNMIIHGDNLEALKSLLPKYEGKIKCIYIDPPYNTGKEQRIYSDNVNHPKIKKWLGETVGKEGEDLSRDDKRLCMMYPRLKILHKLLKEDGVFFCSIDDYEHASLKLMLDEIFGPSNFINNIVRQRAYSPINTKKRFSANHDFICCYAKNKELVELSIPRTDEANDRYSNPDNDPRGIRKSSDLSVGPAIEKKIYEITLPSGRTVFPPNGRCRVLTKERFQEFLNDNRIRFGESGNAIPSVKRFLSEVKDGITPMTVWTYEEVGHNQDAKKEVKEIFNESKTPFDTPKPTRLIERILSLGMKENDIVLDSFAGSGTTAHAVMNRNKEDGGNRTFILIELMDYANDITAERVKRVAQGYGKGNNKVEGTGGSFDYYELGDPLFIEEDILNENVGVDVLREYIRYTETHSDYPDTQAKNKYYLGTNNDTDYYFYYEKKEVTTLNYEFLSTLEKTDSTQYLIYADICALSDDILQKHNIIFKKIPRDISKT